MRIERGSQPTLTGTRVRPDRGGPTTWTPWSRPARPRDPALDAGPVPYEREHAEGFVGDIARDMWAKGGGLFAVEPREGGPLAGSIALFEPRDGFTEAGYWTAPGGRRQGFTAEALRVLTAWAFDELGLHRVELHVDPENAGSRGVAERAGFRPEGNRAAAVPAPRTAERRRPVRAAGDRPVARRPDPSTGHAASGQRRARVVSQGAC